MGLYANCNPCREVKLHLQQKRGNLGYNTTVSNAKASVLETVEYSFIIITPRSALIQSGSIC